MATSFDLVLTMEEAHVRAVETLSPSARGRVFRLGKWSNFDVPDPYRKPREAFEDALRLIDQGLEDWQKKAWGA
jgi:protein-tyrosine phosphatase